MSLGEALSMLDAEERVTGHINYALNIEAPGMLVGKILRSPLPHAHIVRIDIARAQRLTGVGVVLSRDDFGPHTGYSGRYGRIFCDQTVVALDKVRFVGDPVAAVAACDEDTALEALSLIDIDYEEIPAVFDETEALTPTAPLVHDPRPEQQPMFSKMIEDLPAAPIFAAISSFAAVTLKRVFARLILFSRIRFAHLQRSMFPSSLTSPWRSMRGNN